jgi:site-specific DNA-methyltransferase (adenine-specific)
MENYLLIEEKILFDTDFDFDNYVEAAQSSRIKTELAYVDRINGAFLYRGNCLSIMDAISLKHPDGCFDMVFADPPYFLSNGGITCHAGKMVKVDKGAWDKSQGLELNHEFHTEWLKRCQKLLKPNGTLWVSGTMHAIYSIGFAMQQLGFKILNDIIWENPNLSRLSLDSL